jgi:Tol biopolymer transport system component
VLVDRANGADGAKAKAALEGLGGSRAPAVSANGRYVAFESDAANLIRGHTPVIADVFVRDLRTNRTMLVSRRSGEDGAVGDEASGSPAISANGRFVAFDGARDLHPESPRDFQPVLVRDLRDGRTILVSRASGAGGAVANDASEGASISDDGRSVAFESEASNLHPADRDHRTDVFVRDLERSRTILVSRGRATAKHASISADGRFVAFEMARNVYVHDLRANTTTLVSRASGPHGVMGDGRSENPAISADGRHVAFEFWRGSNLDPDDTDRKRDVYVRDLETSTTTLVSRAAAKSTGSAYEPSISADGRLVTFSATARNLDPDDTDSSMDVYVRDLVAGTTRLISRGAGTQDHAFSDQGVIAADGRSVVFASEANNLHPDDRDSDSDVFRRRL